MPALGDADLDPHLLLWDIRRTVPTHRWPTGRCVVAVRFSDVEAGATRWWIVVCDGEIDVCDVDPGHPVTVTLTTTLRVLTRIWRGDVLWLSAIRHRDVTLDGPALVRREVPSWFGVPPWRAFVRCYSTLAQAAGRPAAVPSTE